MSDPDERAKMLARRAALDRLIRMLPPSATRDVLVRQRDRIPIADRDPNMPGHTQPPPPSPRVDRPPPVDRPIDIDPDLDPPRLDPCVLHTSRANGTLASVNNRWWQNWGKTRAYIAERMFFPTNVYEVGAAIRSAEEANRPVRAVGGGWSFSDCNIPGDVDPNRPFALGIEMFAELAPLTETFPTDPFEPVIAGVDIPTTPAPDGAASLLMINRSTNEADSRWVYLGAGAWNVSESGKRDLLNQLSPTGLHDPFAVDDYSDADYVEMAYDFGFRPVAAAGPDGPGTLAMYSASGMPITSHFYNGGGVWTWSPHNSQARMATLAELRDSGAGGQSPRRSTPALSLARYRSPERVFLINTHSLASSLQQGLPSILSEEAQRRTAMDAWGRAETYYFHVEAGITMAALGELLQHQSPRLAIEATGGNPGATLAGSLATATHGGEFNLPLLSDRIKAVHLVGPGGLQWWIEGTQSIADPDRLLERYPCLTPERILTGEAGQYALDATVVSLGCMGVAYSMVVEVVPLFGIHEAVVETSWSALLERTTVDGQPVTQDMLRDPSLSEERRRAIGLEIMDLLEDGERNGTQIRRDHNQYIDLAIDPNPALLHATTTYTGPLGLPSVDLENDWKCWVLNREKTHSVPFDAKPTPKDRMGLIGKKLGEAVTRRSIAHRLYDIFNIEFLRHLEREHGLLDALFGAAHQLPAFIEQTEKKARRLFSSADVIDTALDLLSTPLDAATDSVVTSAIVSAVFSGLLGIEDGRVDSTDSASKVGAIGFPMGGIMGTAIEIGLPSHEAWPFLQTEILDRVDAPFFGYISVRVCPATRAYLGMQQWAPTVLIEIVAFGTTYARAFVRDLQRRTVARIRDGFDAMLHWGLENDELDGAALRAIPSLNNSAQKLFAFLRIRAFLKDAAFTAPDVFASAFTRQLELDTRG